MPWALVQRGGEWCVVKDGETEPIPGGCHASQPEAQSHLQALYANEPDVRAAAEPCSCHAPISAALLTEPLDELVPMPEYPPAEWFEGPPEWIEDWRREHGVDDDGILRLTVTDEGRVGGWFFDDGQCLVHDHRACPRPSPTGYAAFHQQDKTVEGGQILRVGAVGNVGGHASPLSTPDVAQRRYADPNLQMFVARAGDDPRGGWLAGVLVPGSTWGDVEFLRRCALSGDWRPMPDQWFRAHGVQAAVTDGYDCIGPTLVTRPGLPLVRAFAGRGSKPVFLGGCGGVQLTPLVARQAELASSISPTTTGDPMDPIRLTLTDGSTVELREGQALALEPSGLTVRQAAPPPPPPPPSGDEPPADDAGPVSREEFERLVARMDEIEAAIEMAMSEAGVAAKVSAAVDDRLAEIRMAALEDAPPLPV